MTRKLFVLAMSMGSIVTAYAAEIDCVKIADDGERLKCYDIANGVIKPPPEVKYQDRPPVWLQRIKLRSDGNLDKLGKDPAAFSISSVNGEDASLIKGALIVLGPATEGGWQSFGSYGINRNTLTKSKSDVRALTVGVSGTNFDYVDTGFSVWTTLSAAGLEDLRAKTASTILKADAYLAIRGWADAIPFAVGKNEFRLLPRLGLQHEDLRKVKAGNVAGNARGAFLGFRFDFWPGTFSDRVQITAQTTAYRDFSVDSGLTKRNTRYHQANVDYYLYDQNDRSAWFVPIISLERTVGEDPIFGVPRINQTLLSLKLKIN